MRNAILPDSGMKEIYSKKPFITPRLTDSRRREAIDAFNRAEHSRRRLRSLVRFWIGASVVLLAALGIVLTVWLT